MLMRLLDFISSGYVITLRLDNSYLKSLPEINNFVSASGIHYYLCGDASSGIVITAVSIDVE